MDGLLFSFRKKFKIIRSSLKFTAVILLLLGFVTTIAPTLSGSFFINSKPNYFEPGYSEFHKIDFHHVVPSWVLRTIKLLKDEPEGTRILILPSARANVYYWGYGSSNDVLMENQNNGIVSADYGEGYKMRDSFDQDKKAVLECIASSLQCDAKKFREKLETLGIAYIIIRNDFNCLATTCFGEGLTVESFENIFPNTKIIYMGDWTILKLFNPKSFISHSQPNKASNNLQIDKLFNIFPIYKIDVPVGSVSLNVPFLSGWIALEVKSNALLEIHNFSKNVFGRPQLIVGQDAKLFIIYKGYFLFLIALIVNFFIVFVLFLLLIFCSSFRNKFIWKIS